MENRISSLVRCRIAKGENRLKNREKEDHRFDPAKWQKDRDRKTGRVCVCERERQQEMQSMEEGRRGDGKLGRRRGSKGKSRSVAQNGGRSVEAEEGWGGRGSCVGSRANLVS